MQHAGDVTIIKPPGRGLALGLAELWEARELALFLAWKTVKVRYKQTAIGFAWAFIQPLLTMIVFSLFFGRLAKVPSNGIPYPIFSYAALVPWYFFSNTVTQAALSLVNNAQMLQKVYFPRLVLPVAAAIATFVDLVVASVVLGALMGWYGIAAHGWSLLAVPAFLVLAVAVALTVGIALSAINVRYRDVAYALPFLLQLWLFATPIAYPASILHEPWRTIYGLNPMAGVVEGIRWALLGTPAPGPIVFVSVGITAVGLFAAVTYFARTQRLLADVV